MEGIRCIKCQIPTARASGDVICTNCYRSDKLCELCVNAGVVASCGCYKHVRKIKPAQGPCFYCNAPATTRPNKPTVCENCHQGIQKEKENILFDPSDITKARSNTLPPCVECNSVHMLAIRRNDIRYAVTACIECQHRRVLTEAEYLQEWPDVPECEHEDMNPDTLQCTRCFMQFIVCRPCSLAGGAERNVHHTAPECPQ